MTTPDAAAPLPPLPPLPPLEALVAQVRAMGVTLPPGRLRADGFGDSAALSEALLELIRSGRKRAGTGLLWGYEADGEPIAETGDVEIIVDHLGRPALVTRVTRAWVTPFDQVTAEYAAREGEGDGSLQDWRDGHWRYYSRECARIGREPSGSMPVVCCEFEVLHVLPVPAAPVAASSP